jgi:sugar lactone lactonase YvrE
MKNVKGLLLASLLGFLAACSGGAGNDTASPSSTPASVQGTVHGGQAPIVGAAVTLYAVSNAAQSSATALASTTTDANGNFSYNFTCPSPTTQLYLTATGGNPGGGANSAIHLMTIMGPCGSLHRSTTVNELTTIAAAYTVDRFIGPAGCADCSGGRPASVDNISGGSPGLPNALANAANLADPATGADGDSLPTNADCASSTPPANCNTVRKLNVLGNAMAACVNSAGPTSSQCVQFFDCATPGAAYVSDTACSLPAGATAPADTLQAALSIARNPATVSILGLDHASAHNAVFSPGLVAHPADETLSLNFTAGGINNPVGLAVDSQGNVWVANQNGNSVSKLGPSGAPLSPAIGFKAGGLGSAHNDYIAIDSGDHAWVANTASVVIELDQSGNPLSGSSGNSGGGLNTPQGIAIAPTGEVWVANYGNNSLTELSATGAAISPAAGFTGGGVSTPEGIAVAPNGNVWVGNFGGGSANSASEFDPTGNALSGSSGITGGGLNVGTYLAIDPAGNAWFANHSGNSLSEISPAGIPLSPSAGFTGGGLSGPYGIAVDAAGNLWAANFGPGTISEFSPAGTALSGSSGFTGAGLSDAFNLAVDPSGNVWVTSLIGGLTVYYGVAAPTRTPIVAALTQGFVP